MTKANEYQDMTAEPSRERILLFGATGQVGFELQRSLAPLGELVTPSRQEVDLTDTDALRMFLDVVRPDRIVNAAAWTGVDAAEEHAAEARAINTRLSAVLAEYAAARDIWLVHYSTDYVYPGTGEAPWKETDDPAPLSVYGQTKLEGDKAIEASGAKSLIFRTSWVYSARGSNFMKTMLRLGAERDALKVVSDQIGSPTPARLIAEVTALALHRLGGELALSPGIYHLTPRGETSWHGFAREIFTQAIANGHELAIDPTKVDPIPTADWPTPATRPLNSRLSLDRIEKALGIRLPDWKAQLALTLAELHTVS
jgi:dTDP-4-dehydrorhamnose reductase